MGLLWARARRLGRARGLSLPVCRGADMVTFWAHLVVNIPSVKKKWTIASNWVATAILLGGVLLLLLLSFDQPSEAQFETGVVAEVAPLAGQPTKRLVTVALNDEVRVFQIRGSRVQTVVGKDICVRKTKTLIGGRDRFSLVLPGFCNRL